MPKLRRWSCIAVTCATLFNPCAVFPQLFSIAAEPTQLPTPKTVSKEKQEAKAALTATRYKEARDLFLKIAAADPKDYRALHGAGIAFLYLRDNKQANRLLEQAASVAPA